MVEQNIPAALILEDDFDLQANFKQRLGEYLSEAEGLDWNLMYLGKESVSISTIITTFEFPNLGREPFGKHSFNEDPPNSIHLDLSMLQVCGSQSNGE